MPRDTCTPSLAQSAAEQVTAYFRRQLRDCQERIERSIATGWPDPWAERNEAHFRRMLTIMGETP